MSTLANTFQARREYLQSHMTVDGFDELIADVRHELLTTEDKTERGELRDIIEWAREGKARCRHDR